MGRAPDVWGSLGRSGGLLLAYSTSSRGLLTPVCCSWEASGLTCWVRSWKAREMSCLCSLLLLVSTPTMALWSTPEQR